MSKQYLPKVDASALFYYKILLDQNVSKAVLFHKVTARRHYFPERTSSVVACQVLVDLIIEEYRIMVKTKSFSSFTSCPMFSRITKEVMYDGNVILKGGRIHEEMVTTHQRTSCHRFCEWQLCEGTRKSQYACVLSLRSVTKSHRLFYFNDSEGLILIPRLHKVMKTLLLLRALSKNDVNSLDVNQKYHSFVEEDHCIVANALKDEAVLLDTLKIGATVNCLRISTIWSRGIGRRIG
ncbi:hypothetical protein Tco_1540620 [Tanacetum coccineum]